MGEKRSVSEELRALKSGEPDCGEPSCEDCAYDRKVEALAARVEAIAGEMRGDGVTLDGAPQSMIDAWAAELAPEKEGK